MTVFRHEFPDHGLEVVAHPLQGGTGKHIAHRARGFLHLDFDDIIFELTGAQPLAHPLTSRLILRRLFLFLLRLILLRGEQAAERICRLLWRRNKDINETLLCILLCLVLHFLNLLLTHHPHGGLDEITHDGLHVASDVADLGELGRLHLQKWRTHEARQTAGNLRLADTGRANHEDVFRNDVLAHIRIELTAPPAIAQSDRDRALRLVLTDNILVELGDDLARCLFVDSDLTHDSSTSTVM